MQVLSAGLLKMPHFSEGRDLRTINVIADGIARTPGCSLLDVDSGKSTNRSGPGCESLFEVHAAVCRSQTHLGRAGISISSLILKKPLKCSSQYA